MGLTVFRSRRMFSLLLAPLSIVIISIALTGERSQATIWFNYGLCNASSGCDQSINFNPATHGNPVIGNTNPAKPFYWVTIESHVILHGSGSTVDNGTGGSGVSLLTLTPDAGFYWGAIDFQLDSLNNDQPHGTGGLTFTAWDQFGNAFVFAPTFPWENNKGENQHYSLYSSDAEVIAKLEITYSDPLNLGNAIQDIHNIDVNTIVLNQAIATPEPSSLWLIGISLIIASHYLRKIRWPRNS